MSTQFYSGERRGTEVTVVKLGDKAHPLGKALDPRLDLRSHSPDGFEWGYGGSGPAQLALALLADHTQDDEAALRCYRAFKDEVVSKLDEKKWELRPNQIDEFFDQLKASMELDLGGSTEA